MRRVLALAAAVLLGACLAGCIIRAHGHPHGGGMAVVIPHGHVHSAHCGHYFHKGKWYHWHGHRHGPGCGHILRGGVWIIVD